MRNWASRITESVIASRSLTEAMVSPDRYEPPLDVRSVKVAARRRSGSVRVLHDFLAKTSGVQNGNTRVYGGEEGKIIGYDGNNYTILFNKSGRVELTTPEFQTHIQRIPDLDLAFTDPEASETMSI